MCNASSPLITPIKIAGDLYYLRNIKNRLKHASPSLPILVNFLPAVIKQFFRRSLLIDQQQSERAMKRPLLETIKCQPSVHNGTNKTAVLQSVGIQTLHHVMSKGNFIVLETAKTVKGQSLQN